MGSDGHLRLRRSRSSEHSARLAFLAQLAKAGRLMGRTANHRHRFPARLLSQIRFLPPKLPASRARNLRKLSQRPRTSSELLSLRHQQLIRGATKPPDDGSADETSGLSV